MIAPAVVTFAKPSTTVACGKLRLEALRSAPTALKEMAAQLSASGRIEVVFPSTVTGTSTFTGSGLTLVHWR